MCLGLHRSRGISFVLKFAADFMRTGPQGTSRLKLRKVLLEEYWVTRAPLSPMLRVHATWDMASPRHLNPRRGSQSYESSLDYLSPVKLRDLR
ncbi:hypothetical protein NC653_005667 [Populus alba x Populus x berolinensis]|uniref:Uncharacterized protein n=1 Tax=Populus alba x Populus x berolinensis TaxID=444605 RepID=A0AAD6RDR6_9ROSI|nr:hypothetical protein NC653_005667 [Populus alba x Populus x berolinensis]